MGCAPSKSCRSLFGIGLVLARQTDGRTGRCLCCSPALLDCYDRTEPPFAPESCQLPPSPTLPSGSLCQHPCEPAPRRHQHGQAPVGKPTTLPNVFFLRPVFQMLQGPQRFRVTLHYNLHNCQTVALIHRMACIRFILHHQLCLEKKFTDPDPVHRHVRWGVHRAQQHEDKVKAHPTRWEKWLQEGEDA